jgi:hypothetical protein
LGKKGKKKTPFVAKGLKKIKYQRIKIQGIF